MELTATIAILGLLAGMSVALVPSSLSNLGSKVDARRLYRDLNQTRTRAIATGDDHRIIFTGSAAGSPTGYIVQRIDSRGRTTPVDVGYLFAKDVQVSVTGSDHVGFTFEGTSFGASSIALYSPSAQWTVAIAAATGYVSYAQVQNGGSP